MCSIFGYCKLKNNDICKDFISGAIDLMKHRGPDNENFIEIDEKVGFGHQRLAIIDTNPEANQPMKSEKAAIIFNGEIYNYIELKSSLIKQNVNFKTKSDTEVLLKGLCLEDVSFLNKCNGMFAFAFYNKDTKLLVLARDRFGVKPLHYMVQDGLLYFSSEIKPLIRIKHSLVKNIKIYDSFIKDTATDFDEDTFIKDIYQLKKGCYLTCNESGIKIKQWYSGNDFKFDERIFADEHKTLEFTEELLSDAIAKRLRSDVPVCITLSGGIDSSTIYTLTKEKLKKDITPFTFRHPGSKTDEYDKVRKLVASCDGQIDCVQSDIMQGYKFIDEALYYLEFPTWSLSALAYMDMYQAIRNKGFIVVLEGHSSDEQLGGYPETVRSAVFEYLKKLKFKEALKIYKVLDQTTNPYLEQNNSYLRLGASFIKKIIVRKKLDISFNQAIQDIFDYRILPIALRTFDRITMRSSIESRSPFMDYRVVEFFKKMPLEYKISEIGSKAILRRILKKYKKDFIYQDKKKMGFAYDIPAFFRIRENKEYIRAQIEKFSMNEYGACKRQAILNINKDDIGWVATAPIWKVASLSIINQRYGI